MDLAKHSVFRRINQTSKDFNKNEDKPNWSLLPQEDGSTLARLGAVDPHFPCAFQTQEAGQLVKVEKCNLISPEELENESA